MNTKYIKFSVNQIILGNTPISISDFDLIKNEDLETHAIINSGKEEILSIKKVRKNIYDERFVLIYLEEGDRYPYSDKVIDPTLQEVNNPRSVDEIELKEQFFVLVDSLTSRIFLSDQRKKNLFITWLERKIKKEIIIKPLLPEEEFIKKIRTISEIGLTIEPDIFNSGMPGIISQELVKDIFGFGAATASLKMTYTKNSRITDKVYDKISNIIKRKKEFKNITIIGRSSANLESILNTEEVVNKIFISVTPDETTQKFNSEAVFLELILKIRSDENN